MRIRKKAPKPSAKRPPLYFLGYRGTRPMSEELVLWYDQAYGGPLRIIHEDQAPDSWQVSHGPWSAHVVIPLPPTHTVGLVDQLAWEHDLEELQGVVGLRGLRVDVQYEDDNTPQSPPLSSITDQQLLKGK